MSVGVKFGTCTVVGLNGLLVKAKMFTFTLEFPHFIFKCPMYSHDGGNAKFSNSCDETDYSVCLIAYFILDFAEPVPKQF